jgi:hypothetical protein
VASFIGARSIVKHVPRIEIMYGSTDESRGRLGLLYVMYEWLFQEIAVHLGLPGACEGPHYSTVLSITGFTASCLHRQLPSTPSARCAAQDLQVAKSIKIIHSDNSAVLIPVERRTMRFWRGSRMPCHLLQESRVDPTSRGEHA